jgi:hypothetical protein
MRLAEELSGAAAGAEEGPREEILRIARQLPELSQGRTAAAIEEALLELEQHLLTRLAELLPAADAEAIRSEIAQQVAGLKSADEKTIERTKSANLKRLVRRRFQIPRLSLFG